MINAISPLTSTGHSARLALDDVKGAARLALDKADEEARVALDKAKEESRLSLEKSHRRTSRSRAWHSSGLNVTLSSLGELYPISC